jgi:hypothetical protein
MCSPFLPLLPSFLLNSIHNLSTSLDSGTRKVSKWLTFDPRAKGPFGTALEAMRAGRQLQPKLEEDCGLASGWPLMVVAAAVIEAALRHATLASRYTAISAL